MKIINAQYVGDYTIRVIFNDGAAKEVDFKNFLQTSLHPDIRKYLDKALFSEFQLVHGNINWNDYDMIFPVEDLYEGII